MFKILMMSAKMSANLGANSYVCRSYREETGKQTIKENKEIRKILRTFQPNF